MVSTRQETGGETGASIVYCLIFLRVANKGEVVRSACVCPSIACVFIFWNKFKVYILTLQPGPCLIVMLPGSDARSTDESSRVCAVHGTELPSQEMNAQLGCERADVTVPAIELQEERKRLGIIVG